MQARPGNLEPRRPRRLGRLPVAILLLTLGALALRLYCLDCYGLWYDEVASILIARRGPLAIFTDRFGGMLVQTPLHYLIVWLTQLPFPPERRAEGKPSPLHAPFHLVFGPQQEEH